MTLVTALTVTVVVESPCTGMQKRAVVVTGDGTPGNEPLGKRKQIDVSFGKSTMEQHCSGVLASGER